MATGGLAQAARLIRSLRAAAPASLLVDNGDLLQGNLLGDWVAARAGEGARDATRDGPGGGAPGGTPHPMIAAMNALRFDAGTLGNHEFNYGLSFLRSVLARAAFPVVSANMLGRDGPFVPPWAVLPRAVRGSDGRTHPLRVGVIGFAPPQVALWDRLGLEGAVRTLDIVEAARLEVPRLRTAGAEVVVALCHSGIGAAAHEPGMENAAVPLAAVEGIDAVVAGHTHVTFPGEGHFASAAVDPLRGTIHGKPAVQPGFHGSHVGVIDLDLVGGPGAWRVAGHAARAERVVRREAMGASPPVDAELAAIAAPFHAGLVEAARRPVGRAPVPLRSFFSMVAADATLDVVADAQRLFARRLVAGTPDAHLPVLVAVAPFRTGGRAGPPELHRHSPGTAPPAPSGRALRPSQQLHAPGGVGRGPPVLARARGPRPSTRCAPASSSRSCASPCRPGTSTSSTASATSSIPRARPAPTPRGASWTRARDRVGDLRHEGRPVAPGDRFALATNSYRSGSGGGFAAAEGARIIAQSPRLVRDLVLEAARAGRLAPDPRPRWRFASLPGTRAWFDSAPKARDHLHEVEGRDLRALGPAPDGFWRYEISL
jgi:2',3'-cyclic-nucleotide 2'-phosphodiesterase/3'-nucleotidase